MSPNKCLLRHVNRVGQGEGPRGTPRALLFLEEVSSHWRWTQQRKDRRPCTGTAHGLTHAQPARGVQRQALWTLAAEGTGSVVAAPVGTDPKEDLTLIHI